MTVQELLAEKIKHYKNCYLPDDMVSYETLVAILRGLLVEIEAMVA